MTNSGLRRIPEISHLDIQFCDGSIDILSHRALAVNGERGVSGPLDEIAPDDYVRLPGVTFQLDLDIPLFFGLFHKGVQVLTAEKLGNKWFQGRNSVPLTTLTLGGKLSPRQMAQAMLLFPVPLGPMTMFR